MLGQPGEGLGIDPERIGGGDRVTGVQPGARQPALLAGLADAAIDRHGGRGAVEQVTQRGDQGDVHDVAVTETRQLGKMVDYPGHGVCSVEGGSRRRQPPMVRGPGRYALAGFPAEWCEVYRAIRPSRCSSS